MNRIKNGLKYIIIGGFTGLLLASNLQAVTLRDRLNAYLERADHAGFNEEVTSEVRPLIEQIAEIMRKEGYCYGEEEKGSMYGMFGDTRRTEVSCYSDKRGKEPLFGDIEVKYVKGKSHSSQEGYAYMRTLKNENDFDKVIRVEDLGGDGYRSNQHESYKFRGERHGVIDRQTTRKFELIDLLVDLNSKYASLLREVISRYESKKSK